MNTVNTFDRTVSPVGWYIASFLLRFVESERDDINDADARFLSWENTILVRADTIKEAYDKAVLAAKKQTKPYRGGKDGIPVQWKYVGITEVLPVYEELADGSEIVWAEHKPKKLQNLKAMTRTKAEICG